MNAHPVTRVIGRTVVQKLIACLSLLAFFLPLAGCAGAFPGLESRPVPEAGRIAIPDGGPATGTWSMRDVDITYKMQRTSVGLEVSGAMVFNSRVRDTFNLVRNFGMSIVYLDGQGSILGAKSILTAAVDSTENRMEFATMAAPPTGAESVAFRYTGEVLASDGEQGGSVAGAIFDGPR